MEYIEKEIKISEVEELLKDYDIEVESPDGFVPINFFVNKGLYQEYVLYTSLGEVKCNENHLFETIDGWKSANELINIETEFLTKSGYLKGVVKKTENIIPIVDINVDHKNHRYYTNNISSHNTGVGKSLTMCHLAAAHMMMGYKVLYITLEMSEKAIGQRIDANLLGIDISDLKKTDPVMLKTKMANLKKHCLGGLVIQEYPTSTGHVGHFRHLLQELKTKKKYIPDVIYIDYINICASSRYKSLNGVNSYSYIKAIAEELRGLAVEFNLPIITATQSNRDAVGNSDIDMDSTSESYGLPMTLDLYLALIATEEMQQQGLIAVKQLKNRYNDLNFLRRFVIGIDKARMRLHDVTDDVQQKFYNFSSKKKGRGGL